MDVRLDERRRDEPAVELDHLDPLWRNEIGADLPDRAVLQQEVDDAGLGQQSGVAQQHGPRMSPAQPRPHPA